MNSGIVQQLFPSRQDKGAEHDLESKAYIHSKSQVLLCSDQLVYDLFYILTNQTLDNDTKIRF